ncbi:MAG: hypothetical protein A4E65_00488 [Syntrophorhabdus sp. PtaU1.Bin153]|nr:MAG: hypothetical protein A4E65_00488 [Syntrophorhabdus sp. PtaU1.Bin153]
MTKTSVIFIVSILIMVVGVCGHAQDFSEMTKIRYLIDSIEALEGAKFIRNGREYDAQAASSHLRLKLKAAGARVRTAEDFIKFCASKSSITGKPYFIRFGEGSTIKSEVFFRHKLQKLAENKL